MRIGIFDPYLDTLSGGERYMLTAASCLSRENEVDIFWDDDTILSRAHEKLQIDLTRVKTVKNIFSTNISLFSRLLQSKKYDRIFVLSDGSFPLTFAKKTIVHFQFPVEWVNEKSFLTKLKINKITNIVCNSKYTKYFIDKKFGVTSMVLYPPCGEEGKVIEKEKKNIILSIGRYDLLPDGSTFKKHEILIDVFKEMIKTGLKEWELIIVLSYLPGQSAGIKELEDSIKGFNIKIIKNANFSEIKKLYSQAKIYWHAAGYEMDLASNPELAEHFGITTVEAMNFGVVPVVINSGGQKEIIENGVNGFLWDDKAELIEKTKNVIQSNTLRSQMAKNSIKKAKEFSTKNFCNNLSSIFV